MNTFVLDCSVIVKWLSSAEEDNLEQAKKLYIDLFNNKIEIFVPNLLWFELINVLIKSKLFNEISINEALQKLFPLNIHTIDFNHKQLSSTANIALQFNLTAYDASYMLLANEYQANLITCDKDLINTKEHYIYHLSSYQEA